MVCNTTYLPPPEGAGEFMACTMSVVRASNRLVMNSTFFPSGQPGTNQRESIHQNDLPTLIGVITVQWTWSAFKTSTLGNQYDFCHKRLDTISDTNDSWWIFLNIFKMSGSRAEAHGERRGRSVRWWESFVEQCRPVNFYDTIQNTLGSSF